MLHLIFEKCILLGCTFANSGDFVKDATDDFVTDDCEGLDILRRLLNDKSL